MEAASITPLETIELLYRSASLHDIGKVGIPDSVLLSPGILTDEEYREMKKHTLYGREAIRRAERIYGEGVKDTFLQFGKDMAYYHHERWDGHGYPEGLKGEDIPLFGRIMAVADVYDALICKRRYKPSFSHEEAVSIIGRNKGTQFDPSVVDAFLEVANSAPPRSWAVSAASGPIPRAATRVRTRSFTVLRYVGT